jgi:hypothetical protein
MRQIRRAAVTGLFAIWLAPLSAGADAPRDACCRERPPRAEAPLAQRGEREEEPGPAAQAARD